jgi:hypothetical protein
VGIDLARRALARPDALSLTLTHAPRVARSLARFYGATAFKKPLDSWVVDNVNAEQTCQDFCVGAGFTPPPSFPATCGDPGC